MTDNAPVARHVMGAVTRKEENAAMLHFPAAERNVGPIVDMLAKHVDPASSFSALEIASGGGIHMAALAKRFPSATWQPTDVEESYLASVKAYAQHAGVTNVAEPRRLDLLQPAEAWPSEPASLDLIFAANVLHITPFAATEGLVAVALRCLRPRGRLVIYGPFAQDGVLEPESNRQFDASLRARDPSWGVRDLDDVTRLGAQGGLVLEFAESMPANNKMVFWRRT